MADRLPDHVVMAFRHLVMLVPGGTSGLQLLHDDLGPAAADTRLDERVASHLLEADRLITGTLAPAALLTDRIGVFAADRDDVALEDLRAYFARHPQLPKLGSTLVLQNCVSRGVRDGVFGIALGASWNAPDSVLKIGTEISADEVQFQPGVYLVKAGPIREEIAKRAPVTPTPSPVTPEPGGSTTGGDGVVTTPVEPGEDQDEQPVPAAGTTSVHIKLTGVPADRARDVLKVAILPLAATGATVEVNMQITANSENGIPAETPDLVVAEGLRQLGIEFEIDKQ